MIREIVKLTTELLAAVTAFIATLGATGIIDRLWPEPQRESCFLDQTGEEVCLRMLHLTAEVPDDPAGTAIAVTVALSLALVAFLVVRAVWVEIIE